MGGAGRMSDGVGPRRAACADLSGGATGRVASRLFDADRLSKIEAMSLVRLRVPSVLVATCNGCATVRSADAGRDALIAVAPLQMSTVRTSCTQSTGQQVTINERRSLLTKPGRNEADGKIGARGRSD